MELELVLKNSTPLLTGWYEPNKIDQFGLRTTEIKGLWRWWARAFVGGVLYDKGYLKGQSSDDILLKPTPSEVKCLSKLVGKVLGLGLAIGEESMASKFKLYVEIPQIREVSAKELKNWSEAQRIRLLTIKNYTEAIQPDTKFKLRVEWPPGFPHAETALKILVAAIQLTGLGKGSRKGLGSLDIVSADRDASFIKKFFSAQPIHEGLKMMMNEIYRECEKIVSEEIRDVEEYCQTCEPRDLPPLPVVSKRKIDNSPVTVIKIYSGVTSNLFLNIHNFFIRSERCRVLFGTPICQDDFRKNLDGWFLGLPRSQKGTGYIIETKVVRRASPIHITLHSDTNKLGGGAFVTTLLSGDWPREINWFGGGSRSIIITSQEIIKAYSIFDKIFDKYMLKINARGGLVLWP